jgi:hypothetical protein
MPRITKNGSLPCPYCGFEISEVCNSYKLDGYIRRRRICKECRLPFHTLEVEETTSENSWRELLPIAKASIAKISK